MNSFYMPLTEWEYLDNTLKEVYLFIVNWLAFHMFDFRLSLYGLRIVKVQDKI